MTKLLAAIAIFLLLVPIACSNDAQMTKLEAHEHSCLENHLSYRNPNTIIRYCQLEAKRREMVPHGHPMHYGDLFAKEN